MSLPESIQKAQRWKLHPKERHLFLLFGDFLAGLLALFVALFLWANNANEYLDLSFSFLLIRPPWWFYLLPFVWLMLIIELYDTHRAGDFRETLNSTIASALLGLGLYALVYFSSSPASLPRFGVAVFLGGVSIFTLLWRIMYIRVFTMPEFMRRVLVVGGGQTGRALLRSIEEVHPTPFLIVGIIDDDPDKQGVELEGYPVLGGAEQLLSLILDHNISDIIVAISSTMEGVLFQALLDAQENGVEITGMQTAYEEMLGRVPIFHFEADWILRSFVEQSRVGSFYLAGKRLIDLLGGMLGVLVLIVVFPFVSLAVLLETGRPVIYTQIRSGKGGQPYRLFKFRTMYQDAEKDGQPRWAKENDDRTTTVGMVLRKTHIDELPQFFNVLRGDMSLVGPRPERPALVTHFQEHVPFYRARLLVKPGISGWAQVNFGYTATVEETAVKLEYDLYYIKNRSMLLDILILLRTPATMLGLRGR